MHYYRLLSSEETEVPDLPRHHGICQTRAQILEDVKNFMAICTTNKEAREVFDDIWLTMLRLTGGIVPSGSSVICLPVGISGAARTLLDPKVRETAVVGGRMMPLSGSPVTAKSLINEKKKNDRPLEFYRLAIAPFLSPGSFLPAIHPAYYTL